MTNPPLNCDYCKRSSHDVEKVIASPLGTVICNRCVELCVAILDQEGLKSSLTDRLVTETNKLMIEEIDELVDGLRPFAKQPAPGEIEFNHSRILDIDSYRNAIMRARELVEKHGGDLDEA